MLKDLWYKFAIHLPEPIMPKKSIDRYLDEKIAETDREIMITKWNKAILEKNMQK